MKIALIIASLQAGGAERVITELAAYWQRQGHDVTLITFEPPTTSSFYPLANDINLIQLDLTNNKITGVLTRLLSISKRILSLRRILKKLRPHTVISFIDVTNVMTLIATIDMKHLPVIVSERTHPKFHKLPRLYVILRQYIYSFAYRVIVQTQDIKNYFYYLQNVVVIPNAVLKPKITKWPLKDKIIIRKVISVGRLDIHKDFTTLIKAVALLMPIYPDLTLTIYGEGPDRYHLQALIQSLNLNHVVQLPGITKNVMQALNDGDIFVFPSQYEGFPNALCEAMAVGLPIVATNIPGNVDIIQDGVNGRLFTVGDHVELSTRIAELIEDREQCERLSEKAKTIFAIYNPQTIYNLWDEAINIDRA